MKKIGLLVPDEQKLTDVKRLLADYEGEVAFAVGSLLQGVAVAKQLIKDGAQVIIARGENAASIRRVYPEIAVVDVPVTGFDLVSALEQARQFGQKIAVVAFPDMIKQIERLESALGVDIKQYNLNVRELQHVNDRIDEALQNGADVILGGFFTIEAARLRKLPCVLITSGWQAYMDAFFNARSLLHSIEEEKRKVAFIRTLLDHSYEGILSIDEQGAVTVMNPVARKILRFVETGGSKKLVDIWPELHPEETLASGRESLNQLYTVNGIQVLCSKVPLKDGPRIIGAVATFQDVTKIQMAEARIRKEMYAKGHVAQFQFADIYGASKSVAAAVTMAKSFAAAEANILITGETGTGKEVFAQSIHNASRRRPGPFVAVNCAALPAQLLESELFGYVGGAFTGANREGKAGLFEVAHTGTIFLDEIGELDYVNQGRLLRVLQERTVVRVGSDRVLPVDVRVVAATNKNLSEMVAKNTFREDLFYRLNVLHLPLPPLRERKKDIGLYAKQFLKETAGRRRLAFSGGALKLLEAYRWSGNIRELRNMIERIAAMAQRETISVDFVKKVLGATNPWGGDKVRCSAEAQRIVEALERCNGKISETAKLLEVSRSTLWRKMNRLGIKG